MISFVLPTRDRAYELGVTLEHIGSLPPAEIGCDAEVIVVDNASDSPALAPPALGNGVRCRVLRCETNLGTAARNLGAEAACGAWVVMLDDDSHPVMTEPAGSMFEALDAVPADVAAIGGEIFLPGGTREAGGLPEVFVGCGCAIRRDVFCEVGGYDAGFDYYAEEYDVCARLLLRGCRVTHDRRLRFVHRKVAAGRSFERIIRRLIRNNLWVVQRYAPRALVGREIDRLQDRYADIARRERVEAAFCRGLEEGIAGLGTQAVTPMPAALWDRFVGRTAADRGVSMHLERGDRVRPVALGKGWDVIEQALDTAGVEISGTAATEIIGTLSPGPMLDAAEGSPRAIVPWEFAVPVGARDTSLPIAPDAIAPNPIAPDPIASLPRAG